MEFFLHIFSKWRQTRQTPKKIAYLSKYCFDVDDVDINLYIFWEAEAICEVTGYVRGHANVVAVKVMLTK